MTILTVLLVVFAVLVFIGSIATESVTTLG
jgi:hypothetical protein